MKLNVDDFKRLKEWLKGVEPTNEDLANFVNLRIKEWLDSAPTMYGCKGSDGKWYVDEREDRAKEPAYTHKAKLVCIEEINSEFTKESERLIERVDPKDILDE